MMINHTAGSAPDEATAALAGQAAVRGAASLNYNHFKIPFIGKSC